MDKKNYIINQLKRTFNKKYENYCITRILHRLNRLDVKFVTQQLFKRSQGRIALADLYFPQINLYVEIDESHHLNQKELDIIRTEEMLKNSDLIRKKISNLEEIITFPLEELRISVNYMNTIEDINLQIDNVVDKISKKISHLGDKFVPWTGFDNLPKHYTDNGKISVEENAGFRTLQEVSELFNKGYRGNQKAYFKVNCENNIYVWCPILKLENGECKDLPYDNEVSENCEYIYESSKKNNEVFIKEKINSSEKRYVFAKYRDETGVNLYKFKGVYELDRDLTLSINKRAWKKIDNQIYLKEFFK